MDNKRIINIFIIVFKDLLGFNLILGILPFYADQYGVTTLVVGFLIAIYTAAQLFGALLLRHISDWFGRRIFVLFWHIAVVPENEVGRIRFSNRLQFLDSQLPGSTFCFEGILSTMGISRHPIWELNNIRV
jgi:MFS family permease